MSSLAVGPHHPDVGGSVKVAVPVNQGSLPHGSGGMARLVTHIEQLQRTPVQNRLRKPVPLVGQLKREKWSLLLYEAEKYLISLPQIQIQNLFLGHPFQSSLAAGCGLPLVSVRCVQTHVLRSPALGGKCHKAPKPPGVQSKPRLLLYLPQKALLRTLPVLKVASHTDPFILIYILLFAHPMKHEIRSALLNIAEGCKGKTIHFSALLFLLQSIYAPKERALSAHSNTKCS